MFTEIKPKDLVRLQSCSYKIALQTLQVIKDVMGTPVVLVTHLAKYWNVPEAQIMDCL
jgi:hypothetical protein